MLPLYLFLAAMLAFPSVTRAQEGDGTQGESATPAAERHAIPRGSRPQGANPQIGTAMPRAVRPSSAVRRRPTMGCPAATRGRARA